MGRNLGLGRAPESWIISGFQDSSEDLVINEHLPGCPGRLARGGNLEGVWQEVALFRAIRCGQGNFQPSLSVCCPSVDDIVPLVSNKDFYWHITFLVNSLMVHNSYFCL